MSHPFDQLNVAEMKKSVAMVKAYHKGKTLHFKTVESLEPVS